MKKVADFLIANYIAFYFSVVATEGNPENNPHAIQVPYIDEKKGAELLEIASSEGLVVSVANSLIISEPLEKKKAVKTDNTETTKKPKASAPAKPAKVAAPKKAVKKKAK